MNRMPTASLEEALNLFDPQRPLEMSELNAYYVARPHAPLEPMKTYLRVNRQPIKVLFSGHRGSGKSTELTRLAKDLENEFFIVRFSARVLNLADLNYVDIILTCAAALFREATDKARKVRIPAALWKDVLAWLTQEITTEIVRRVAAEIGNDFRRLLLPEHYEALRKARVTKQITPDETVRQLLENLSLLEYRNDDTWCDAHTIVRSLL
jgi:hypothetical protein